MNSRTRLRKAIQHKKPDKVPFDLGSTDFTGIHASMYIKLRKALGLKKKIIKVVEPFQMLAEVEPEVIHRLGIDTIGLQLPTTIFGFNKEHWKKWRMPDGNEVLVPGKFNTTKDENDDIFIYPQGDMNVPPSAKMPKNGFYFDAIVRENHENSEKLNAKEWVTQQYSVFSEEDLLYIKGKAEKLYTNTELSIIFSTPLGDFGNISNVSGLGIKHPKGIRNPVKWLTSHIENVHYILEIFDLQCEIALKNLDLLWKTVGDKIDVVVISGTDFGTQNGPFISPQMYKEMYKPYHKKVNDWVHNNTTWKTLFHSCGAITPFLDDFVEAGVDILNPVQCSAKNMSPEYLKSKYGKDLVFWGGGIDTQKTLPFGNPNQVREQVIKRLDIFNETGGYVFNSIHNIQPKTPIDNLITCLEVFEEYR